MSRRALLLEPTKGTVDSDVPFITVTELCCEDTPTQHRENMASCEDTTHDAMARIGGQESLDGIVLVTNKRNRSDVRLAGGVSIYGSTPGNIISDHDCIKAPIAFGALRFPLVTHNVEGLCDADLYQATHQDRKANHRRLMNDIAESGMIMCFQELALKGEATTRKAEENGSGILRALAADKPEIPTQIVFDDYTGGVIYDSSHWMLYDTITIRRPDPKDQKKKSNAYLFVSIQDNAKRIWVVNIHLKALMGTYFSSYMPFGFCDPNSTHVPELKNILEHVHRRNANFDIPVFLIGDYNSTCAKDDLVTKALRVADITPESDVELL